MNPLFLDKYMRMFDLLDIEAKLELMTKFSENISQTFKQSRKDKTELLESLSGSWADVDNSIVDDIYNSRTLSDKGINLVH
jgi:hypothetical protein